MNIEFRSPPWGVSQHPSHRVNQPIFCWVSSHAPVSIQSAIASFSRPGIGRFAPMNSTAFSFAMSLPPSTTDILLVVEGRQRGVAMSSLRGTTYRLTDEAGRWPQSHVIDHVQH